MTKRRTLLRGIAGGVAIAGFGLHAQPAKARFRIGFVALQSASDAPPPVRPLIESLHGLGFAEGRDIAFEYRYADGRTDRLPNAAGDLVSRRVDVIVAGTNPQIAAALGATKTIPIVMAVAVDPVGQGFVKSLARPGGNVTGLCIDVSAEMMGKNLALLAEAVPELKRVGVLRAAQSGWAYADLEQAARKLALALEPVDVANVGDIDPAFGALSAKRVNGVVMLGGALVYVSRHRIAELAIRHRLPMIHAFGEYADAGLLMTYGASLPDLYRRAGGYVARILRGARPADLPIEQPQLFELVVNLATAKLLGLALPPSLVARADRIVR